LTKIPVLTNTQASPRIQELWSKAPFVLNINRLVAHAESAYKPCMSLGLKLLTRAELPARYRELVILRIAHRHGARYEWSHHERIARNLGFTEEEIQGVRETDPSACFSDLDRAVLRFADELICHARAPDELSARLREHLSDRQMVELILSIGYWNMIAMLIVNAGVELEEQEGDTKKNG